MIKLPIEEEFEKKICKDGTIRYIPNFLTNTKELKEHLVSLDW